MGVRWLSPLTHSGSTRRPLGGRTLPTVPALEAKKGTLSLKAKKGSAARASPSERSVRRRAAAEIHSVSTEHTRELQIGSEVICAPADLSSSVREASAMGVNGTVPVSKMSPVFVPLLLLHLAPAEHTIQARENNDSPVNRDPPCSETPLTRKMGFLGPSLRN